MKADGPREMFVPRVEAAPNQIANHDQKIVKECPLRRHLRIVTSCHQHVFILFDLENELFLHKPILPTCLGLARLRAFDRHASGFKAEFVLTQTDFADFDWNYLK